MLLDSKMSANLKLLAFSTLHLALKEGVVIFVLDLLFLDSSF
jgi:hypothetical protein